MMWNSFNINILACKTKERKKLGFTLAEVLITLLIIGVVASLVVPGLINDTKNVEYVVQLKKAYGTLSNAYNLIIAENGGSIAGTIFKADMVSDDAVNAFANKLNVVKKCYDGQTGCWTHPTRYLKNAGYDFNTVETNTMSGILVLGDGSMIAIDDGTGDCNSNYGYGTPVLDGKLCGSIIVDVNGSRPPNRDGRDTFYFHVTSSSIIPIGAIETTECLNVGKGCAGKVIKEQAMNY